jgi:energy-coupling factor transport system permease protein
VPAGPKARDWIMLAVIVVVCGAALAVELTVLPTSSAPT